MESEDDEDKERTEEEKDRQLVRWLRERGFDQLARDVNEERFAFRILENQRWIDAHDFALSSDERMQESIEARLINYNAQLFDKAAAYNNVVVSLGYAGFFAIWNFTQDYIPRLDNIVVAILLGVSLIIFIIWTLSISFHNTRAARRMGVAVAKELETRDERVEAMNEAELTNQKAAMKFFRIWPFVYVASVGTGFSAGLLLLFLLAGKMLNLDWSLENLVVYLTNSFVGGITSYPP